MTDTKNIILNTLAVSQKTRRIAYQILESNSNEKEVIIVGIVGNGLLFAKEIVRDLNQISDIKTTLCEIVINKKNPLDTVSTTLSEEDYKNKSIVLVDDVLNSGATLIYAVKHFLNVPLKRFKTAVLVNRNHKKYPVKADFKGISLSTSIKEHVVVEFNENETIAYLM
ncbi:phosphoribosyltransferase domain-containing protein [Polaribacter sp.]|jgi:pyrimidine operon attenuation protein/uracil phosphoribosyltransferase|nr:phosphoribosyltransferase domain-containing protein [Polaribacter sp.]MDA9311902.1 phosphoribosyltransferase domain-containing protein [Polaribacter sp.]MDA9348456.1 phosphoribosyltransferase domain-containing protein [Polaribacter sp.]MDA9362577.1 phosphoribosyltransferase domain-containing protein [Polaribacter sp.]MDA9977117.1 phosphoribosyltransferase domain-containing protein [Polaribacter sp.]